MSKKLLLSMTTPAIILLVSIISLCSLAFFVKGDKGNPIYYQTHEEQNSKVGSPFESSNSTSRYILTQAMVDDKSMVLTEQQALFASPDVALYNGKFLSLFMPGISFFGVPFYLVGEHFGMPQLFTYLSVTLFGFINMFLIMRIAYKLGANVYASLLAGFLFLFATNGLAYSLFYTQHVTSVTFLLLSILAVIGKRTIINAVCFGFFAGINFLLDLPNIMLLLPVGIYFLSLYLTKLKEEDKIKLSINTKFLTFLLGFLPFILLFGWYNLQTTGTYTQIAQTIGRTDYFQSEALKAKERAASPSASLVGSSSATTPPSVQEPPQLINIVFKPRAEMNGFYTLVMSNERSWIFYSPIVLFGIFGLYVLYKKNHSIANMLIGVVLLNIVVYSMFGDPWGGWAFGPRYLIPAAAILSIGVGLAIQRFKRNILFGILFVIAALYSLIINIVGALTTSAIPPKIEAIHFSTPMPYTYEYNIQLANENRISSLVYNLFFSQLSAWTYIFILFGILVVVTVGLYYLAIVTKEKK